jgi:predicted aspartyl protease
MLVIQGPTLIVDIGFDPAYMGVGNPNLSEKGLAALVDTGAHASFIDDALAKKLNLPVVDRQKVSGSAGQHEISMYLAHIYVPSLDLTQTGQFGGVHLVAGGQRHSALIGRTFLMHFTMTYNGMTGEVEITQP